MKKVSISYKAKNINFVLDNPKDYIQNHIIQEKTFYEITMLEDIYKRVIKGDVIVDAGAYIGNHTLFFGIVCGGKVYSYEPYEESYDNLLKNIKANEPNHIKAFNFALGSKTGSGSMTSPDKNNIGMNKVDLKESGSVTIKTLDSCLFAEVKKIKVIKIDVEGMEVGVIQGALNIIERDHPYIYVEAFEENRLNSIKDILGPIGYEIEGVFNNTPTYLFVYRQRKLKKLKSLLLRKI